MSCVVACFTWCGSVGLFWVCRSFGSGVGRVLGFVFIVFPVAYGVVGCLSAWLRLACCYCVGCLLVVWFGFVDYVVWLFVSLDVFFVFVGGLGLFY